MKSALVFSSLVALSMSFSSRGEAKPAPSYFSESAKSIGQVLKHKAFRDYADYLVESYREGEIGESQAFFVRLVKPFATDQTGVCFVFLGPDKLQGQPHGCASLE